MVCPEYPRDDVAEEQHDAYDVQYLPDQVHGTLQ